MAMRPIWSGALSFGLINIPVKVYSASNEKELSFHFLHKEDLSPVRFAKICRADGKEIPYKDIVRGYEYEKGDYIILTDEDFKMANPKKSGSIEIAEFVDEKEINPIYFDHPYFLEPDKNAEKAYALLREAMKKSKKIGVAKFVFHNKEHLGAIKADKKVLILEQMKFKSELREPKSLNLPDSKVAAGRELEMAISLVKQLTSEFKPEEFKDTYSEDLKKIISEKSKGRKLKPKTEAPQMTRVTDLMDILKQSLEREQKKSASGRSK